MESNLILTHRDIDFIIAVKITKKASFNT